MPNLTPEQLAALREAAEKATAGTWRTHPTDDTRVTADGGDGEVAQALGDYQHDWRRMEATAAYIVAAQPQNLIPLLNHIDALAEQVRELEAEIVTYDDECANWEDAFAQEKARAAAAEAERNAMRELVAEAHGCFVAARIEGWADALADGDPERIKDLWQRRISFAEIAVEAALTPKPQEKPDGE